jgi:hypothetical protein
MTKTVFIAHQISGDVEGNIKKVIAICKVLHLRNILPVFPSFTWRQYLPDNAQTKYYAGLVNDEYFRRRMIDEVWLYGNKLSEGMLKEINLAISYGIPVVPKNKFMKEELKRLNLN